MPFGALETGLKFDHFHGCPGRDPDRKHPGDDNFLAGRVPNKHFSILTQSWEAIDVVLNIEDGELETQQREGEEQRT